MIFILSHKTQGKGGGKDIGIVLTVMRVIVIPFSILAFGCLRCLKLK